MNYLHNLLFGASTILQLLPSGGQNYVRPQRGDTYVDQKKIAGDYLVIGRDMKKAADHVKQEYNR